MSSLKKFAISYSQFFTSGMVNLLFGFVTFPVLTRVLTREEYGIVGLVTTTMYLVVAFAKSGLSDGIIRFYEKYSETPEKRKEFASTVAVRGFIFSFVTVILYLLLFPRAMELIHINRQYLLCFLIMGGTLFLSPLNIIVLNIFRASGKTLFYNVTVSLGKVIGFGMSLLFFMYLTGEFYGYFIGLVLSEMIVSSFLFYWFFSNYKVSLSHVSGSLAFNLIKFGFPLLITELSYLLLTYADRYMLAAFKGEAVLGLYSVGYNIASYISNLVTFSLSYAVIPIYVKVYEREGREKTEEFLQKCFHYLLIFILPLAAGFFAVSNDLFITLASEKYGEAGQFSPIILIGSLFLGINNILNAGLYLNKKSNIILLIMISALGANLAMNYFWIPRYGIMGATFATLFSCIITTILTVIFSFTLLVVRMERDQFFYYLVLSGIMYLTIIQIHTGKVWGDLIVKILVGILVIAPGVFFREKEIQAKIRLLLSFVFGKES